MVEADGVAVQTVADDHRKEALDDDNPQHKQCNGNHKRPRRGETAPIINGTDGRVGHHRLLVENEQQHRDKCCNADQVEQCRHDTRHNHRRKPLAVRW